MDIFFLVLVIICSILLILIVLIQKGKGGGLTAGLGQGNQMMGVKKTTDFLEKSTWVLISATVIFSLFASFFIGQNKPQSTIPTQEEVRQAQPTETSDEETLPIGASEE